MIVFLIYLAGVCTGAACFLLLSLILEIRKDKKEEK